MGKQVHVPLEGQAALSVEDSQARLELATSAAQLGIWDWDLITNRFVYSARAKEICGFDPDQEVTYELVLSITHPQDLPYTSAQARRALDPADRDSHPYEYRLLRADGSERWVLAHGAATFDEVEGQLRAVRYVGTLQDVTERHQLQIAERGAAQRLRLTLEASRMAEWEYDFKSDLVVDSPGLNRLLGFPEGARPTATEILEGYYPGERRRLQQLVKNAVATGERFIEAEYRYIQPSGTIRWLQLRCELTLDQAGVPAYAVGVLADITTRKDLELRQAVLAEISTKTHDIDDPAEISYVAAEVLGRALNVSRVGYGTIDKVAETITIERDWNAASVEALTGTLHFRDYGSYIEDLKSGETVVFADAERDPRTRETANALKAISAQSVVNVPVTEQGGFVALLYVNNATARQWSEAELLLIKEVAEQTRVLVERRRAERELRDLNATLARRVEAALADRDHTWSNYRAYFENTAEALFVVGVLPDGGFVVEDLNPAHQANIGFRLTDVAGKRIDEILPPDTAELVISYYRRVLASGEVYQYRENFELNGETTCWDTVLVPVRDGTGQIVRLIGSSRDLTRQVAAEEQLRQVQKMEAMGQLTGGVAHDFNNLLTPIVGVLDMLQRKWVVGQREQRLVSVAALSAERAKTLVQRLLAFARRQPLQPIAVDVAKLLRGMADLLSSTMGPQIRVVVDAPVDLPPARADTNQLEMALLNLAVNARDAMPDGGTLRISASADIVRSGGRGGMSPGRYIHLSVADTGVGMDETTLVRAIEPFFTTKGIGKGTGLGLSMVHGLASQLGGALSINSKVGLGTNAELWLPQAEEMPAADALRIEPEPASGRGTVLLVDDEEFVRLSTGEMLRELGYRIIEAASAEEALQLISNGARLDLLVTDHLMPGMTGTDLARLLRERHRDLAVLVISGYADVEGVAPDLPRLTKPFRRDQLVASLANLSASIRCA